MKGYNTYRHISTLDTDLFVWKVQYWGAKYFKVRASIINRYDGIVYETKTYKLNISDLHKWKKV